MAERIRVKGQQGVLGIRYLTLAIYIDVHEGLLQLLLGLASNEHTHFQTANISISVKNDSHDQIRREERHSTTDFNVFCEAVEVSHEGEAAMARKVRITLCSNQITFLGIRLVGTEKNEISVGQFVEVGEIGERSIREQQSEGLVVLNVTTSERKGKHLLF